jgi:FKBP-type peptidyl-prolyl cis-trans isomerase 2
MKSAYELAMSRLEKSAPTVSLTENQKRAIAEVDSEINAKLAEKKLFLEGELVKADPAEKDEIRRQLASEIQRLEEKREREKEKIRASQT